MSTLARLSSLGRTRRPPAPEVQTVPIGEAREWARLAFKEGKAAGCQEAVKSLEASVEQLVRLGVQVQRK